VRRQSSTFRPRPRQPPAQVRGGCRAELPSELAHKVRPGHQRHPSDPIQSQPVVGVLAVHHVPGATQVRGQVWSNAHEDSVPEPRLPSLEWSVSHVPARREFHKSSCSRGHRRTCDRQQLPSVAPLAGTTGSQCGAGAGAGVRRLTVSRMTGAFVPGARDARRPTPSEKAGLRANFTRGSAATITVMTGLAEYAQHHNEHRPHQSREQWPPLHQPGEPIDITARSHADRSSMACQRVPQPGQHRNASSEHVRSLARHGPARRRCPRTRSRPGSRKRVPARYQRAEAAPGRLDVLRSGGGERAAPARGGPGLRALGIRGLITVTEVSQPGPAGLAR